MTAPTISADSHICEIPDLFTSRVDRALRDQVPYMGPDDKLGDALDIGPGAQLVVVMDPVIDHSPRPEHPAGRQDPQAADDGAGHPGEGRDQGNQHRQQVHGWLPGSSNYALCR